MYIFQNTSFSVLYRKSMLNNVSPSGLIVTKRKYTDTVVTLLSTTRKPKLHCRRFLASCVAFDRGSIGTNSVALDDRKIILSKQNKVTDCMDHQHRHGKNTYEELRTRWFSSESMTSNISSFPSGTLFQFDTASLGLIDAFVLQQQQQPTSQTVISTSSSSAASQTDALQSSVLHSIRQLPEIETAIQSFVISETVQTSLERSCDIFSSFNEGGIEHKAALALLAECYVYRNDPVSCINTIHKLQEYMNKQQSDPTSAATKTIPIPTLKLQRLAVSIAQAKAYWLAGSFQSTLDVCEHLYPSTTNEFMTATTNNEQEICARTGHGLARLLQSTTLDDVYTVKDPFRMTIKALEHRAKSNKVINIALAAAYMNMGIAEVIYAETVAKAHSLQLHHDVPLDNAMKQWKMGLTILKQHSKSILKNTSTSKNSQQLKTIIQLLEAKMNTNMAWGLLQMTKHDGVSNIYKNTSDERLLEDAFDYAGKAAAIYASFSAGTTTQSSTLNENDVTNVANSSTSSNTNSGADRINKKGLNFTLTVIAECYEKSGNAVVAEGLLQSAVSSSNVSVVRIMDSMDSISATNRPQHHTMDPCQLIASRYSYDTFSNLCAKWEKRETEAEQHQETSEMINEQILPLSWRNKSCIHSSLWFWTPSMLFL